MFENLRSRSKDYYGSNEMNASFSDKGITYAEQWFNENNFTSVEGLTEEHKKECSEYIKKKLYENREEIYKGIITTILIQVLIQIIVKWITANIFT